MFIICAVSLLGGIGLGILIQSINSCKHDWSLFENGEITRTYKNGSKATIGWVKAYECSKCKKMKKEQVRVDVDD